jgi:hypothetical protein
MLATYLNHVPLNGGALRIILYMVTGFFLGLSIKSVAKVRGLYNPHDRATWGFFTFAILLIAWGFRWLEIEAYFGKPLSDGLWPYVWDMGMSVGVFFGFSWTGRKPAKIEYLPLDTTSLHAITSQFREDKGDGAFS